MLFWVMIFVFNIVKALQSHSKFLPSSNRLMSKSLHTKRFIQSKISSTSIHMSEDNKSDSFYITTPIYYVNGQPHLGHAYTSIASDVLARFQRCKGKKVFFLTGTDEHGQKVEQSAAIAKQTPIEFADTVSESFRRLTQVLDCSNDDFIRTTQPRHKDTVEHFWNKLKENDQIYLGAYEGWYSIRDEAFYNEDEIVDGKAPTGAPVEWVKESSYFFRLSQWTDKLLEYYDQHPEFVGPRGRRNEVISFVGQEGGLRDLSISRTTFKWGIPVPNDPAHVVYVWLDALTNYLTAIGYPGQKSDSTENVYNQFWPADLHIVGKDILRFHAVYWPAFLMAAGVPLPKRVFAHGWWTRDGEKMSKSIGNVIDPFQLVNLYGVDYVRYFLISEILFGSDGDFTHEAFSIRINTDLANDIGNLLQRTTTFICKQFNSQIPVPAEFLDDDLSILKFSDTCIQQMNDCMEQQNLKGAAEAIVNIARQGNRYIDTQAPWKSIKTDVVRCGTVLYVLAECMRRVGVLLQPVMPQAAKSLLDQLSVPENARTFASLQKVTTVGGTVLPEPYPIFPKIDLSKLPPEALQTTTTAATTATTTAGISDLNVLTAEQLTKRIASVGDSIRDMKARKATKEELKPIVDSLLALKDRLKAITTKA